MRYILNFVCCFYLISSFAQDVIPDFKGLSDVEKDQKVSQLLAGCRSIPEPDERIKKIREIANFCKSKGDKATEALAMSYVCIAYIEMGNFDEAKKTSEVIENKYFDHLLPRHQVTLNLYRSQTLISLGELNKAIELAQETLPICEKNDLPKNNVYGLLSTVYTGIGRYKEALDVDRSNLHEILHKYPETKNALGQAYYSLSRDFTHLNILDSANYYGELSLDHWDHPVSLIQLGQINTKLGAYETARAYLIQAESVIDASPRWQSERPILYLYLSRLEIHEAHWGKSLEYAQNALKAAEMGGDIAVSHKAYENIVRSLLEEDGFYLDSLLAKDALLRDQAVMEQTVEMDTKYKTFEKEKEILELNNSLQEQEIDTLRWRNYLLYAVLFIVVLIASIYLVAIFRRRKTRKEIDRLKKQALQLQMNPHFFFNSLNSIHNFIGNRETEEAQKYLVNFSKLMRLSLENSQENFVSIKQEAAFLENFLILEQLRTKNFDFELLFDEKIEMCKIPTLLIQPLVENSLLHGFSGIEHRGMIRVEFKQKGDAIQIEVSDNGIGRSTSLERKQEQTGKQSFGMEILKKRIALYTKNNGDFIIGDKQVDSDYPGTSITFTLPLFE